MLTPGPNRYDAFLSYNSEDRPAVEALARRLRDEGLELYLEVWELTPGREFQPALAEGIRDSNTCVVFLGPNGLGPWQNQEVQVAIDLRTRNEEYRVIPVLLPGFELPRPGEVTHLAFLLNARWVEFFRTLDDEQALRELVWGIKGTIPERPGGAPLVAECPYRGLEAFGPDDARYFFGRKKLTAWLASALGRGVRMPQGGRFLGVLGPSGSGKSSVVLAGLVSWLKEGAIEGSARWPVAILRPGDDPLQSLARALVIGLDPAGESPEISTTLRWDAATQELAGRLAADKGRLHSFAETVLHQSPPQTRLVVVVDQFEEIFTLRPQDGQARARYEPTRDAFLANLLHAATTSGGRVAVVLTMRSDFLSACAAFPQLAAVLSAHQELVVPMSAAELREAIERPAFLAGCGVEPALIERQLADVEGQPGALPLVQFALTEVWKKRDARGNLTLRAYEELGGVRGALEASSANEIYCQLSPEDQELCKRLFLRLVQPGEGTEDTKRRVSFRELLPDSPARAESIRRLIQTLSDRNARLITTEGDVADGAVEVTHEALIQGWTKLREWVARERDSLRTQRRLTEAAQEWAAARSDDKEDYLYSGARLAVSREWAATHSDELSAVEATFLAASEEAERQREQNELENERRQREAAEAAARRQTQLGRRFFVAAVVAAVFAATSGGLALWANKARLDADIAAEAATKSENMAIVAQKKAKAQARIADSRRIAASSEAERDKHLDRALLLAVEALKTDDNLEARTALLKSLLARPGLESFLHVDKGYVRSVVFSPDGRTLGAWCSDGGGVVLWDVAGRRRLAEGPLEVPEGHVFNAAFSPDGLTLATGFGFLPKGDVKYSGGVVLWDVARRRRLAEGPLEVPEGAVVKLSFSPDGQTLAAGYDVNMVSGSGGVKYGGGVVLWDVAGRRRLAEGPLEVPEGAVSGVAFSRDGLTLAAGYNIQAIGVRTYGGGVVLWDVAGRRRLAEGTLEVPEGHVTSVAFSRDGLTLATGFQSSGVDGVVLWDVAGSRWLAGGPLEAPEGHVSSVAFSPDGLTLAAGFGGIRVAGGAGGVDYGGGVVLWDVAGRRRLDNGLLRMPEGNVFNVAFSPDGLTLAAAYGAIDYGTGVRAYEGGVVLWDVAGRRPLVERPLEVPEGRVTSVAFSPDGLTLAAGFGGIPKAGGAGGVDYGGGVVLWDVAGRRRLDNGLLRMPWGGVGSVAFSRDGLTLAADYGVLSYLTGVRVYEGGVVLWDVAGRRKLDNGLLRMPQGTVKCMAFSPDDLNLAAGFNGDNVDGVVLWDVAGRRKLAEGLLSIPDGAIFSVAFSPDGLALAAGFGGFGSVGGKTGGGVVLWDVARRPLVATESLEIPFGSVTSVSFSRDGQTLAAGYGVGGRVGVGVYHGQVVLWDVIHRRRMAQPMFVPGAPVSGVAFSPDGQTLAAAYGVIDGGGVVLWDVARRHRLVTEPLVVPGGPVTSVAFSPDGLTLAAGYENENISRDGGVVLWDVHLESWQRLAKQIANRNLTRDEWHQYSPDEPYRPTFSDLPVPPEVTPNDVVRSR